MGVGKDGSLGVIHSYCLVLGRTNVPSATTLGNTHTAFSTETFIDELAVQVLRLEHLPEPLSAPVCDQKLQAGSGSQVRCWLKKSGKPLACCRLRILQVCFA